jgi:hypothetical protein
MNFFKIITLPADPENKIYKLRGVSRTFTDANKVGHVQSMNTYRDQFNAACKGKSKEEALSWFEDTQAGGFRLHPQNKTIALIFDPEPEFNHLGEVAP